jgi:CRISPR-associated protein Csa3
MRKVVSRIILHSVNHRDFEGMLLSLKALLETVDGQIIANLSGGPREIFPVSAIVLTN